MNEIHGDQNIWQSWGQIMKDHIKEDPVNREKKYEYIKEVFTNGYHWY